MRKKGFTLVEVIVAFTILSVVILFVLVIMMNQMNLTGRTKGLTEKAFAVQKEIEQDIQEVTGWVETKIENENILVTATDPAVRLEALKKIDEAADHLLPYDKNTYSVFGKNVVTYKISRPSTAAITEKDLTMDTWVAEHMQKEFPTAIVKKFEIHMVPREQGKFVLPSLGKPAVSSFSYETQNRSYAFVELYQWYISRPGFNMTVPRDQDWGDLPEAYMGSQYPAFPTNFEILPKERKERFSGVTAGMEDRFLVCTITPASRVGKMGKTKVSNYIYLSGLPAFDYYIATDLSLMEYSSTTTSVQEVGDIRGGSAKWVADLKGATMPAISMVGEVTGKLDGGGNQDIYARKVSVSQDNTLKLKGVTPGNKLTVSMAIKRAGGTSGRRDLVTLLSRYRAGTSSMTGGVGADETGITAIQFSGSPSPIETTLNSGLTGDKEWHVITFTLGQSLRYQIDRQPVQETPLPVPFSNNSLDFAICRNAGTGAGVEADVACIVVKKGEEAQDALDLHSYMVRKYGK